MSGQEPTHAEGVNITEISTALSGQPHHHDSWGYRAPLDTKMTVDIRVPLCECTDANPDRRPSLTRYESDQVRSALRAVLARMGPGTEANIGLDQVDLVIKAIEQDGNLKVSACTCGPWHPDMDGPDEDCPVHGRSNADLWSLVEHSRSQAAQARRDLLTREDEITQAQSHAKDAIDALRNLVDLKDGPRDAHYEVAKPMAWDVARILVGSDQEFSGATASGTKFHKAVQRLIDESKTNPFTPDLPSLRTPIAAAEPGWDEVTLIVGPEGRVSQIIFHTAEQVTEADVEILSQEIGSGTDTSVLILGPAVKVREIIVTRLPEDEPEVVIEDAQEVSQ